MSRWIDITDDVSKKYYNAFIKQVPMPEYVKSASVLSKENLQDIPSDAFADGLNKKFALNTKANCWCSALYFYGNQCSSSSTSKQAEAKLLKAAQIWGIAADVEQIKKAFELETIPASYAISFEYRGAKVERCPDHTKEAATASAEWLYQNRSRFPISIQKQAAARLLSKADTLKLANQTAVYLDKLANPEVYANINCKIATAITDRLSAISTMRWDSLEDELLKVANDLNARPFDICHSGELISGALEALDIKHGLNTKWGSAIQHPVDACFRVNVTKAAAVADTVIHLTTGMPVDLTKISDHQLEKGLKIAGDDFLSYCQTDGFNVDRSKAAEILPTLPKPEAKRFEQAIKTAGYIPETTYDLVDRLFDGKTHTTKAIKKSYGVSLEHSEDERWLDGGLPSGMSRERAAKATRSFADAAKEQGLELTFSSQGYGSDQMNAEEAVARILKAKSDDELENYDNQTLPYYYTLSTPRPGFFDFSSRKELDYNNHPLDKVEKQFFGPRKKSSQLTDKLLKWANMGIIPSQQAPQQMPVDDTNPMPGEDDASFEARMSEKKEQAKLDALDAQAGLAAVKARQARQQHEQNAVNSQMGMTQGMQ